MCLCFLFLYTYFPKTLICLYDMKTPIIMPIITKEQTVLDKDLNSITLRIRNKEKIPNIIRKLYKKHKYASPGYIYIYRELCSNEYKIGRTKVQVGVNKRLNQWTLKCKKKLQLITKFYSKDIESSELMIHQELRANGMWVKGKNCDCKVKHQEFFMGTEMELIQCIKFWTDYFNNSII